ncbi:MAG: 5'/3'-nucleotidase SurE [Puniceicoccaceae bacterium]|nr:5'/3'-nucleotidase SurE [Puniceicoccaceae bacterium]|tara:strand:+ start:413 stop:1198 length:786 start_codon:yes stop_codon:yes gene_type:complete
MKPHALVTNDDGIQSAFLHRLVEALIPHFRVSVAAPAFEQSWTGRCMTRHGEIEVIDSPSYFAAGVQAWAISGTPSDCVNIALGNLLPEKPDIVLSGINIGFNTTETLILSSGTVAGAIEGVLWDLPAIAFSQSVPTHLFDSIRDANGIGNKAFNASLKEAATHAAQMALDTLKNKSAYIGSVVNINFPLETAADTPVVETFPAKLQLGSLFIETSPGKYSFRYSDGTVVEPHPESDRAVLDSGRISRSLLNFSRIGRPQE